MADKKNESQDPSDIEREFDDLLRIDFGASIPAQPSLPVTPANDDPFAELNDDDPFADLEPTPIPPPSLASKREGLNAEGNYKPKATDLQQNIDQLRGNISAMLSELDTPVEDMMPPKDLLPGLDLGIETHDYEKDIELIKIDSKETLECLANLYLNDDTMKNKNIYKIIRDDANSLTTLSFSISCAKRALIGCMKQLDMGVNDPLMYQSVAMFQKEMRDSVKMAYDLQKKMKDFYKSMRDEMKDDKDMNTGPEQIPVGPNVVPGGTDGMTVIGDSRMLNDLFERYKNDPSLLEELMKKGL